MPSKGEDIDYHYSTLDFNSNFYKSYGVLDGTARDRNGFLKQKRVFTIRVEVTSEYGCTLVKEACIYVLEPMEVTNGGEYNPNNGGITPKGKGVSAFGDIGNSQASSAGVKQNIKLLLAPNPTNNGMVQMILKGAPNKNISSVEVNSAQNVRVYSNSNVKPQDKIDTRDFAAGVYFVKVQVEDVVLTERLIVE